jgi:hypothetical protein
MKTHRTYLDSDTLNQIIRAYVEMGTGEYPYRPAAPSDGLGHIVRPVEELDIFEEAEEYAMEWHGEEDDGEYFIGSCHYPTRPATIYAVEAARILCGGSGGEKHAIKLLELALENVRAVDSGEE